MVGEVRMISPKIEKVFFFLHFSWSMLNVPYLGYVFFIDITSVWLHMLEKVTIPELKPKKMTADLPT